MERIEYMAAHGLDQMIVEDTPAVPREDELTHDWIGVFVDTLPSIRNDYAHGSENLHASVLRTFDIVSDLVNQLFTLPPPGPAPADVTVD